MKKLFVCIDTEPIGDYWDSVKGIFSAVSEDAVYEHLAKELGVTLATIKDRYVASEVNSITEI